MNLALTRNLVIFGLVLSFAAIIRHRMATAQGARMYLPTAVVTGLQPAAV